MNSVLAGNRIAWDYLAARYSSPYMSHQGFAAEFTSYCELLQPGSTVLDLGCGTGLPFDRLLIERGFAVTGVDISQRMIDVAQHNVPEATYSCGSITDVEFDEQFDGVLAVYSLLSLDLQSCLIACEKASLALRNGGFLFVAVNEPIDDRPADDKHCYQWINGVSMYVRPYSEEELRHAFKSLRVKRIWRGAITSNEYGTEHALIMVFEKPL